MRACGAPEDVIERTRASLIEQVKQQGVDVFPENWHALKVFLAMGGQWRVVAGFAGVRYQDLDYAGLAPVLEEHKRMRHRQPLRRLMPQLRTMVQAAIPLLNGDE